MQYSYTLRPQDRTPPARLMGPKPSKAPWVAAGLAALLSVRALLLGMAPAWMVVVCLLALAAAVHFRLKAHAPMDRILEQAMPGRHILQLSADGLRHRAPAPKGAAEAFRERTIPFADMERVVSVGQPTNEPAGEPAQDTAGESPSGAAQSADGPEQTQRTFVLVKGRIPVIIVAAASGENAWETPGADAAPSGQDESYPNFVRALHEAYARSRSSLTKKRG